MAQKVKKSAYIVGFYKGHNATACLLKDGAVLSAASEERFNREKNTDTFPTHSIKFCLDQAGISPQEVDLYVRTYRHPEGYVTPAGKTQMPIFIRLINAPKTLMRRVTYYIPSLNTLLRAVWNLVSIHILTPAFQRQFRSTMANFLQVNPEKIIFADHHLCHAYAAYYGFVAPNDQIKNSYLVITLDGEGDGICGTVSTVKQGSWKLLSSTLGGNSIATFYGLITQFLGMKMNEHEYKVMGLAPYVSSYEVNKVHPLFKDLFTVNDQLQLVSKIPSGSYLNLFDQILLHQRFDGIAGATQKYVEEVVCELVSRAIKKTGIGRVVLSGGFFMNVKANKRIAELPEIKQLIVCPSAADESVVFGAAYWAYRELTGSGANQCQNIPNLYLGPEFSETRIKETIKSKVDQRYLVKRTLDIEKEVAKLLAKGKIVARFKGRMEWGARALGNRSILMNPANIDGVRELNEQVKSRDFWMPFAATILDKHADIYLRNTKGTDGSFMIMAFDTTERGRKDLAAAIHPYDFSCRPQVLSQDQNPEYYRLIEYFQSETGIGAVLNTSFNYHGEPIVCTPEDALHTFEVTGLKYLALGDYLICKK